jgi:thioesterase domain-containing protein
VSPAGPDDRGGRTARLAARRAGLSAEERALLEQRLRARGPRAEANAAAPASLVAIQPAGSRPPFFCVHPAGGDVLCFQPLALHMGTDQPFYGLQSRGLGPGETPLASLEAMAASYRAEIAALTPGPYYLGGWSLGGAVVFELARQLAAEGCEVALLAIVDSTPGPWPPGEAEGAADDLADDTPWLMEIADYLERLWGVKLGLTQEGLRGLSTDEQATRFLAGLQGTPFAVKAGPDSLRRLLAVFKSNVRAFRQFRPKPYPGRITLFRPADGSVGPGSHPAAAADPTLGWGAHSPLPVEIETVPGDHISALAEPHVGTLAERLRHRIDLAAAPAPPMPPASPAQ